MIRNAFRNNFCTRILIAIVNTIIFSTAIAAENIPANDNEFTCTLNEKAEQYIRDFNIDYKSFGGKELCQFQIDSKKLFNDLQIIEQGQFAIDPKTDPTTNNSTTPNDGNSTSESSLQKSILIGGYVDSQQYYAWLRSQTEGMARGNDIPFATAYNSMGYFTMQDGWATLSTLGRVGTVIHEARHTEGYRHIPCTTGPYKDLQLPGCDRNFAYGGSHAVEMEYYARVSLAGQNFHPVYKTMARLMAMARSNFVFNQSPIQKREALLAITKDGRSLVWDNNTVYRRQYYSYNPQHYQVKRTSFGASLFNGIEAIALEIYGNGQKVYSQEINGPAPNNGFIADDYSYYKMLKQDRGQGKSQLLDFEELDQNQKRFLFYLKPTSLASYNFEGGKFNSPVNLNFQAQKFTTTSPLGQSGLFVLDTKNNFYEVSLTTPSQIVARGAWDPQVTQYVQWQGQLLRLTTTGRTEMWSQNQWIESNLEGLSELNQQTTNLITVPLYDAFKVEPSITSSDK